MTLPKEHQAKIDSANSLDWLNGDIKRRRDVISIFFNEAAVTGLIDAILLKQNDEWAMQRRYTSLKAIAPVSNDPTISLPAGAA